MNENENYFRARLLINNENEKKENMSSTDLFLHLLAHNLQRD